MVQRILAGVLSGLAVACGVAGAVRPAGAQESRRGPYIGMEQGVSSAAALRAPLTGNSQPTRCDTLLYGAGAPPDADCPVGAPREIYSTDFDFGAGFAAGGAVGYDWGRVRIEAEYLRREPGSSSSLIFAADDLVASGKTREWNESAPPFARVSDLLVQQAFVNVYFDATRGSRWTPYVGVGAGVARTSLGYGNRYVRKTLAQGYFPAGGVDPFTSAEIPEWQRNAAGSVSAVETQIAETHFGIQALGGVDHELSDHVSLGVKARWSRFAPVDAEFLWDLLRSHESVLADGVTPYVLGLELDGFQYVDVTLGLKYRF